MNTALRPTSRVVASPLLSLSSVGLAALGQFAHTFLYADWSALGLLAAALVLWVIDLVRNPDLVSADIPPETKSPAPTRRVNRVLALGAVLLSLVTLATSRENSFDLENLSSWLLSVAVWVYAWWAPVRNWDSWRQSLKTRLKTIAESSRTGLHLSARVLVLAAILLVTWFFYFYNLDGVPAEMDSDHAEKVLDVNDVVTNGLHPIFFERNTGREPLEFYLIAGLVEFGQHPIDHMALKLVTATVGFLVVPATYLMVRELLEDRVALVTAALIAISRWPVTIARMGLRFPFTPIFLAPTVYFLLRALKYRGRNDLIMTGLFLGVGLYGYNAFRMAPVLVVAFILLSFVLQGEPRRPRPAGAIGALVLILVTAAIVFMPLLSYSVQHPESFWYRVLTRLSSEEQALPGNPAQVLGSNLVNAGLMFNWKGDEAWPNNIPGQPALDNVSGGLFVLGIALAVVQLVRNRDKPLAFVLVGLAIMLLPSALSLAFPDENPSNARAGGAIPFVFAIVALAIVRVMDRLRQAWGARSGMAFTLATLAVVAAANFTLYFRDFDLSYRLQSWNSSEVASAIKGFTTVGDLEHVYLMLYPHWVDTRNVAINLGKIGWGQTLPDLDAVRLQTNDPANKLYVLNLNDKVNLTGLQEIYPNGQLRRYQARTPGHDFYLWYVPGILAPGVPLRSQ